jgi:DNA-binding LacI/PurR family transcriptional regulator
MVTGYFDIEGGRESTATLLEQAPELTAIFAASDEMAMGTLLAARDAGLRVPEDLSVIGVDGHEVGELLGLTTIAQPAVQQGGDAARLLLAMIAGGEAPDASTTLYPTHLVVRTSTAPVHDG